MNLDSLKKLYKEYFLEDHEHLFFAPGRINLIGEHTDYNGGKVFPLAITNGTYALVKRRSDRRIRMVSLNFETSGAIEVTLDSLNFDANQEWVNYPNGVTKFLLDGGYKIDYGFDVLFYGNIPNGAGLSSSASIELVTGIMIQSLFDIQMDRIDLVRLCQRVENEFIGVNSGIMDQFAVAMGKEGNAIWLDCETLQYEYAPIELKAEQIVIMNTNKRRELATSKYNERRNECELALQQIQRVLPVKSLGEISLDEFDQVKHLIDDNVLLRRATHVISENDRTEKAFHLLKTGNIFEVGKLMNESHRSLKHDFEVTGKELDTLVESAWQQDGVIGARMTGAGFGGCAIAIVKTNDIPSFINNVGTHYKKEFGWEASFYTARVGEGAREIIKESS